MDEYLLQRRYLVDDLGEVDIDDGLVRPERMPGFVYEIMIQLPGAHDKTEESSTLSILRGDKKLFARELSSFECRLILDVVSKIKFGFVPTQIREGKCPQDSYNLLLRRGTAMMSFAWSDGEYITNDRKLLSSLMKLVILITDIQPIEYENFGFEVPEKL
jgi:hypothetical protein